MIGSQYGVIGKYGICFDMYKNQRFMKTFFVPEGKEVEEKKSKCTYCNKYEHLEFVYFLIKRGQIRKSNNLRCESAQKLRIELSKVKRKFSICNRPDRVQN
jgi:hypothetical protein